MGRLKSPSSENRDQILTGVKDQTRELRMCVCQFV
jgi:hypothetical protein